MDSSKIVKHIHYHIIKKYNEGHVWCVDEIISFALVAIFPYPLKSIDHKNTPYGTIKDVCNILNGYLGRSKKLRQEIETYSYESLKQYFNDKIVTTLSCNTKKHIVNQLNIASSIENNGFISIRYSQAGCDAVLKTYKEFEVLESSSYGNVEYMPVLQVDKLDENDSVIVEDTLANKISTPDNVILQQVVTTSLSESLNAKKIESTNTPNTLKTLEKTPRIEKGNNKIDLSPDVVLNPEEEKLNLLWEKIGYDETKMPYVWTLRISYKNYNGLKECLINCIKSLPRGYGVLLNFIRKHCIKLFVYVAEWFKWEYQPSIPNNAFTDLGISSNTIPVEIWESLNKWQSFRYSGEANNINLYSIYALGGFPLLAILKSDRIDNLFECLLHEDDIDVLTESLLRVIPGLSDAFRQSLADSELGSWSKYIQALSDSPELLYADCDKDANEYVMHFYERLENGRRGSVEKAIKHNWIFYTAPDSEEITGDIILNIGNDNSDGCVSAEIIKSEEEQLYIGIECQDEIVNYRKYSKTRDCKRFIGWGTTSNRIRGYIEDLSQTIYLCKYNIDLLQPSEGKKIKPFELGNKYIEVYATDDGSGWTTLRECQGNAKAVFFPSGIYDIVGDISNLQNKVIGEDIWSLCEFSEGITLKNKQTGKEHNLYQEGKISVKITPKTDVIKYYDSSRSLIKCYINGQEQYLPLLMGVPSGRCIVFHDENKANIRFRDIEAEYIQNHSRNQLLKMSPKPGLITLDIKQHNFKRKYIYLPKDAIKRNLESETIIFDNLAEVIKIEYVSPNGDIELLSSNVYKDVNLEQLNLVDTIEDVIQFRFYMTEHDFIELDVYRPINCRELSLANRVIKRYNDNDIDNKERIKLPYILRDKFGLKVFDKFGVKNISSFRDFQWFIPASTIQVCDEFDMYMYIDRQVKNEPIGVLDIGPRGWDQYKFYYWSVDMNEPPQQVTTSYDYEKKHLIVSTELIQNKKGLIFQSLEGCAPRHYVKAICGVTGRTNSKELVELAYKCYKMAILHNVTFTLFDPLKKVVENIEDLRDFYKLAVADKSCSKAEIYKNLHKLANEFGFEWFLLPHRFWRRASIDKEQAMKFLQSSNFIRTSIDKQLVGRFLTIYLNQNLKERVQVRKQSIAKTFRYMRGLKKDPQMIPASKENVEAIKCLYESNEWINDLLVVFEN